MTALPQSLTSGVFDPPAGMPSRDVDFEWGRPAFDFFGSVTPSRAILCQPHHPVAEVTSRATVPARASMLRRSASRSTRVSGQANWSGFMIVPVEEPLGAPALVLFLSQCGGSILPRIHSASVPNSLYRCLRLVCGSLPQFGTIDAGARRDGFLGIKSWPLTSKERCSETTPTGWCQASIYRP